MRAGSDRRSSAPGRRRRHRRGPSGQEVARGPAAATTAIWSLRHLTGVVFATLAVAGPGCRPGSDMPATTRTRAGQHHRSIIWHLSLVASVPWRRAVRPRRLCRAARRPRAYQLAGGLDLGAERPLARMMSTGGASYTKASAAGRRRCNEPRRGSRDRHQPTARDGTLVPRLALGSLIRNLDQEIPAEVRPKMLLATQEPLGPGRIVS
jgi:hypothetical protein